MRTSGSTHAALALRNRYALAVYYVARITIVISDERATIISRKRCDSRNYVSARLLRSARKNGEIKFPWGISPNKQVVT